MLDYNNEIQPRNPRSLGELMRTERIFDKQGVVFMIDFSSTEGYKVYNIEAFYSESDLMTIKEIVPHGDILTLTKRGEYGHSEDIRVLYTYKEMRELGLINCIHKSLILANVNDSVILGYYDVVKKQIIYNDRGNIKSAYINGEINVIPDEIYEQKLLPILESRVMHIDESNFHYNFIE